MSPQLPTIPLRRPIVALAVAATLLAGLPGAVGERPQPRHTDPAAAPIVRSAAVVPAAAAKPSAAASALSAAVSRLGRPYRYGASGPNAFDCSGLVYWSYKQVGITLPRTSRAMSQIGTPVSRAALQPGDLVFFYRPVSHVAIYVGDGRVVHASTYGQPVKISPIGRMPFTAARRI